MMTAEGADGSSSWLEFCAEPGGTSTPTARLKTMALFLMVRLNYSHFQGGGCCKRARKSSSSDGTGQEKPSASLLRGCVNSSAAA